MCLQSFDEIPSLPVQDIKEKPKCGQRIMKGNNLIELVPSPYFSITKLMFILWISMCSQNLMKFHVIKEKPKCCRLRITKGNNSNKRIGP